LFFLGLLVVLLFPHLLDEAAATIHCRLQLAAIVLACGILLNYVLVLALGGLRTSLLVGLCLAIAGLSGSMVFHRRAMLRWLRWGTLPTIALVALLFLFAASIMLEPLLRWDARSIWFFHAKIIYYAGGLVQGDNWTAPAHAFSVPDRPKLVPILAAQSQTLAGYWNELLPKLSLLLLIAPILAMTLSFWREFLALVALLVIVLIKFRPELSSGYMDAPLAVYGLFGALQLAAFLKDRARLLDLVGGVVFIAVATGLKNDANLLAVSALWWTVLFLALPRSGNRLRLLSQHWLRFGIFFAMAATSCLLWPIIRARWGLESELHLGPGSLPRLMQRLNDPEALRAVVNATIVANQLFVAALIGILSIALALAFRTGAFVESAFCLAVGGAYLIGLEIVYLSTPLDLAWHLRSSASRATILPILLLLAPAFLLLRDLSRDWHSGAGATGARIG
jgi:hypothetical protein